MDSAGRLNRDEKRKVREIVAEEVRRLPETEIFTSIVDDFGPRFSDLEAYVKTLAKRIDTQ